MILNNFFSDKEILNKIVILLFLLILLILPWVSDLQFNYDLQIYSDLDHFFQKGFYKCFLDNEVFLYVLKSIFRNTDNKIILITTYNFIIIILFMSLIYFVNNLKTIINLLLTTFFSIFAGQFREALAIALSVFAVKLYLEGNKKILLILPIVFFIHIFTFFYLIFMLLSFYYIDGFKITRLNIILLVFLLISFFVFISFTSKFNYYTMPTNNYAFFSFLLLMVSVIFYNDLRKISILFVILSLFCLSIFNYYHLSTRISEISLFFLLLIVDFKSRLQPNLNYKILLVNKIATLFFIYKIIVFFFTYLSVNELVKNIYGN